MAILSVAIAVVGIIASAYAGKIVGPPNNTAPGSTVDSTPSTTPDKTHKSTDFPETPIPESNLKSMDLFEQECTIGGDNDNFGHNADTEYKDADGRGDYRYFVFVTGKDSYGYSEDKLSRTYAIPDGYHKLTFTVGVHPNNSTNIGSAWLEFYDQDNNCILRTDPMIYDSPAKTYTVNLSNVTRLTLKAVPSDDMKEGSNHSWLDAGYFITLLLLPMEISAD